MENLTALEREFIRQRARAEYYHDVALDFCGLSDFEIREDWAFDAQSKEGTSKYTTEAEAYL